MSETPGLPLSSRLRERGRAAWAAATGHPVVTQIGAGTLPHATFRRYFEQNIRYLGEYARAIGLIVGKAPDLAAIDVLSRFLRQIAGTEIPANIAFLERLGGSLDDATTARMHEVTYAYTRHLLATASQGTCAEGLTAVLPCQWSYGALAGPLMASPPADPIYAEWIAMFGNPGYGALVAQTTGLLDRLEPPGHAAASHLSRIFDTSTRYEVQFWDMAQAGPARTGSLAGKER